MPAPARSLGGSSGVSSSSLHAKTFSIDDAQLFIGSFNFDPRSARLNTEMGFVIDSPALARSIAESFARDMPSRSYEVRLAKDGSLRWIDRSDGTEVIRLEEPGATVWKRFVSRAAVVAADRGGCCELRRRQLTAQMVRELIERPP
jgi:putative cardiolipin synthase